MEFKNSKVTSRPNSPPFRLTHKIRYSLFCGLGALLTIGGLSIIGLYTDTALLMAPLGASAVLLFSAPESPLARVKNQLGGHSIAALIGLIAISLPEQGPLVSAIAIAITVTLMSLFSCEHPPAGAVPLVMILGNVDISFLLGPVFCGVAFLTLMTSLFHLALRSVGVQKQIA